MHDPPRLVLDYDQYVEQSKGCCHDNRKVTDHYGRGVVANKDRPTLITTGLPRGPIGMYFRTVRGDTRSPSLSSNSLAIRSSPQDGLSCAMVRMRARSSAGIGGRPGRDFQRQNRRKPSRCHRTKVRGCTTTSASLQSKSLDSSTSATRNGASGRRGFRFRSRYIANCFRRKRFSAASEAGGLRMSQKNMARSRRSLISVRTPSMMANITPCPA
jgi:hypothetical protein